MTRAKERQRKFDEFTGRGIGKKAAIEASSNPKWFVEAR